MYRFSDKNQKAIDLLRTKCLKLKCMVRLNIENGCASSSQVDFPYFSTYLSTNIFVDIFQSLCDGKLYEIMRGNFERADRTSVIRTTVNSKVTSIYFKILPPVSFVLYVAGVDCGIESGDWPRAHPLFILPRTYRSTQPLFSQSKSTMSQCIG